jgi:hypothetical protein
VPQKFLTSALTQRVNITAAFSRSQGVLECVASGQRSSLISVERAQLFVTDCVWLAVAQPAKSGHIGNQSKAAFVVVRSNFGNVHRHRAY